MKKSQQKKKEEGEDAKHVYFFIQPYMKKQAEELMEKAKN